VPWWTYTGTKLETADTAKENLQPIGTPLLGEMGRLRQLPAFVGITGSASLVSPPG